MSKVYDTFISAFGLQHNQVRFSVFLPIIFCYDILLWIYTFVSNCVISQELKNRFMMLYE